MNLLLVGRSGKRFWNLRFSGRTATDGCLSSFHPGRVPPPTLRSYLLWLQINILEGVFFSAPSQGSDVLVRQASLFLTDDEEFLLELSRLHWKTFKENVWKSKNKKRGQIS